MQPSNNNYNNIALHKSYTIRICNGFFRNYITRAHWLHRLSDFRIKPT